MSVRGMSSPDGKVLFAGMKNPLISAPSGCGMLFFYQTTHFFVGFMGLPGLQW